MNKASEDAKKRFSWQLAVSLPGWQGLIVVASITAVMLLDAYSRTSEEPSVIAGLLTAALIVGFYMILAGFGVKITSVDLEERLVVLESGEIIKSSVRSFVIVPVFGRTIFFVKAPLSVLLALLTVYGIYRLL